jgi:hypothetical protein
VAEIDENIEQAEEDIPSPPTDEDVVSAVYYLVDAFDRVSEIDKEGLTKVGVGRLRRIKRKVFNALLYYSELLPEPEKKPRPDTEDDEED